jgi:two-component system sensor histidine kinase/response regulator
MKHLLTRIGFLLTASQQQPPTETVDMTDVFWQLRDLFESRLMQSNAQLTLPSDGLHVQGVTKWVLRSWEELLTNALQHNAPGVQLTVRVEEHPHTIRYVLHDNGRGVSVPPDTLFQPLEHCPLRGGRGWGLTVVERLVSLQHGTVGHRTPAEGGAEFYFELPRAR